MGYLRDSLGRDRVSQRRACRILDQPRSTQRRVLHSASDEPRLVRRMVEVASVYGRYGYRKITSLLRTEGWRVSHKRVERLWRREGLKVPQQQPKRKRLWLADGSCVRLLAAGFGMNCWLVNSARHCLKPRSLLNVGEGTTTRSDRIVR